MSDQSDREAALAELTRRVQPDVEPQIGSEELESILDSAMRASTWAAETVYSLGAVVMPETRNGHRYVAISAGTSGTDTPVFPTGYEATVSDGEALIWKEAGREFSNVYDVRLAENLAWKLRSVRAAESTDKEEPGLYDHCKKEERRTAPIVFA